ncbi:hypothetical protein LSCM1_07522 [Leishmania martiniquensis]|uniref:Uncharacterized protein n=1 Tax=Leishmania martiniquensis TaxID=1580590 RepID=A0A836L1G2_9TRYP|nr:hypothetical protein LSCM1_07522 [Leishmania martiniquensis]
MNRAEAAWNQQQPLTLAYDRDAFLEAMEKYSNYVSSWSWIIGGPSSYFVVEPGHRSPEPSL